MSTQLSAYWENFRSSFWFAPTLMAAASTVLAFGTVSLDHSLPESWRSNGWTYSGGAEGARAVLSVIASSMITVAGVVFSITIVALTLASSQFGPRLLRTFMRDTANQVVLGTFIATFLYCLLVLRTIRSLEDREFVPQLSVTLGVLLGVASLGVLIYFIHHVAISIQASYIVKTVSQDLRAAIDRMFPEELGRSEREIVAAKEQTSEDFPADANMRPVQSEHSGYLQAVDNDRLMEIASEHDLVISVDHRPGRFIVEGATLATIAHGDPSNDEQVKSVRETFVIGRERTSTQDVEFAVSQLVEVAFRALSPGINDPFTAISCIDWLSVGLSQLASRSLPAKRRFDSDGRLRVIADSVTFDGVADMAFNQIREAGESHPVISIRLLEAIGTIGRNVRRPEDVVSLRSHAELIWIVACPDSLRGSDRSDLERVYHRAQQVLSGVKSLDR